MTIWYETGQTIRDKFGIDRCTCCDRELIGHAVRMLELDQRTQTYHDDGDVPPERSQGWFPFGLKCAKKEIAKHAAKKTTIAA